MAIRKITIPVVSQLPDDPLQMKIAQTAFDKTVDEADFALDTLLLDGWVKVGECPIALPGSLSLQIVLFKDTRVKLPEFNASMDGGIGLSIYDKPEQPKATESGVITGGMGVLDIAAMFGNPMPSDDVLKSLEQITTPHWGREGTEIPSAEEAAQAWPKWAQPKPVDVIGDKISDDMLTQTGKINTPTQGYVPGLS